MATGGFFWRAEPSGTRSIHPRKAPDVSSSLLSSGNGCECEPHHGDAADLPARLSAAAMDEPDAASTEEQVMTENNTNAIRALSADEVDLVSGGAEAHIGPVSIYTFEKGFSIQVGGAGIWVGPAGVAWWAGSAGGHT
jgi:hypothetical protein